MSVIDEVKDRLDIVEVIQSYVPLKKAGRSYKGLCPFHEEKTPSFYVVPHKGFYKCFGCGKSGDAFHFVMERQGMDFIEAVKTRGATLADAEVGHRTTSLCHLGHIAVQLGRKLRWDPEAERFPDDETANALLTGPPARAPWAT